MSDEGCSHLASLPLNRLVAVRLRWLAVVCQSQYLNVVHGSGVCAPVCSLDLSCCDCLTDQALVHLAALPLQTLLLKGLYELTDAGLACLVKCPLHTLNLRGCRNITDVGLTALLPSVSLIGGPDAEPAAACAAVELAESDPALQLAREGAFYGRLVQSGSECGYGLRVLNISGCGRISDAGLRLASAVVAQLTI